MNETDQKLLEALRELAVEGPQDAPAALEARLVEAFRKRSQARRRNVWLGVGTAAIAAALALVLIRPAMVHPTPAVQSSVQVDDTALDFYPLPDAEELPPLESATIVRVELPMASLRLMGLPVSEDSAADLVEADMLLGQDGMARGVRLVE